MNAIISLFELGQEAAQAAFDTHGYDPGAGIAYSFIQDLENDLNEDQRRRFYDGNDNYPELPPDVPKAFRRGYGNKMRLLLLCGGVI